MIKIFNQCVYVLPNFSNSSKSIIEQHYFYWLLTFWYNSKLFHYSQFQQSFMSSFYGWRSQKCKRHWWLDCLFALMTSASIKAAQVILLKSAEGWIGLRNNVLYSNASDLWTIQIIRDILWWLKSVTVTFYGG